MKTYDVCYVLDYCIVVTTVEMIDSDDEERISKLAIKKMTDIYGKEFGTILSSANQTNIELAPNNYIPPAGDATDAGIADE